MKGYLAHSPSQTTWLEESIQDGRFVRRAVLGTAESIDSRGFVTTKSALESQILEKARNGEYQNKLDFSLLDLITLQCYCSCRTDFVNFSFSFVGSHSEDFLLTQSDSNSHPLPFVHCGVT